MLDKSNKETFWFYDDENHMMIHQNYDLVFDNGKHDGPEKTCHAHYAYGDSAFINGIIGCKDVIERDNRILSWIFGPYYLQWKRYPKLEWYHEPMSRDHWIYILVHLVYIRVSHYFLNYYTSHTRIQLSKTNWLTPKVWLWSKLISGKKVGKFFYPVALWSIFLNRYWNKAVRKIGKFGEEWSQKDYLTKPHPQANKVQKLLRKFLYPVYALKLIAFMTDVLPNGWWKRQIQKQSWDMIPRYNYVLQLLLDSPKKPTLEQISEYRSMMGDRWSQELNPLVNPRNLKEITDPKLLQANRLDYDFLVKLYTNKVKVA